MSGLNLESQQAYATADNQYPDYGYEEADGERCPECENILDVEDYCNVCGYQKY